MVGGTQQQQPHPQQLQPQTTAAAEAAAAAATIPTAGASAEEEALKRNTDCVYFLASPLTCKKGSECEYRHSDIARVNPRDCWFWLNGNCLNPKCGFRHPPLDGLLGAQVPSPVGSSIPPAQTAATPAIHAPYGSSKQGVPCIFFQKGLCLKGDRCAFLHAPNSINNKVPLAPAPAPVIEPSTLKKVFAGLERCNHEQKFPQINVAKSVELPRQPKPAAKVETAPPKNGVGIEQHVPPTSGLDDELPRYRPTNVPPANIATNGNLISRSNRVHQAHVSDDHSILNVKDADEFSREPSPGFDVLVDDERESDYYHGEDQFGRTRGHEGRNLNPMNEYDLGRSADYISMPDVDKDMYHDPRGYDTYERLPGQYAWEQHRASSERMLPSAHLERRRYPRAESPDQIDGSDLRHRLSKQRRVNGLRSVISHDHTRENHVEDRSYRGSRRDTHHLPAQESSLSSRLRGRIKIPGRSTSPVNGSDLHPEREMDKGRNGGRLSPGRPQISLHQGRLRDRIKGRVQEDFNNEGRNFRGPRLRRDIINEGNAEFAGPKRLADLKGGKGAESSEQHMNDQQSLGKRRYPKVESHQHSEGNLSFEGPKPLSEILKRKRGAETAVSGSVLMSGIEDSNQKERKESLIKTTVTTGTRGFFPSVSKDEANLGEHGNKESNSATGDIGGAEEDGLIHTEQVKSTDGQSSLQRNVSELETEDGLIVDEAMEDHEPEAFGQGEGDYDYEQVDGEDYNLDEGENADAEEDGLEEDDGDDFAKKIGVMY